MSDKDPRIKDLEAESIWYFIKLPDYLSLASIACSIYSIINSFNNNFGLAASLIVASAVFDAFDGVVARLIHRTGNFGVELDSIADVVAFGAAPAILGYCMGLDHPMEVMLLVAFVLASAMRLARFNILKVRGHYFIGMPTTANGWLIPLIYLILTSINVEWPIAQLIYLLWFGFSTILMISILKVPKPKIG
jgi:CDP-diacylglycerol--serine O-phosphatidyltransferase